MRRSVFVLGQLWMAPVTAFGLLQTLLGARYHGRTREGVLQFVARPRGPLGLYMRTLKISAYTLGATITYRELTGPGQSRLYRHELEHVVQTMQFGPLMPVAYVAASLWQVLRGRRFYSDNGFEVRARAAEDAPFP
ncbi:MAG: hypothetical protein WBV82_27850 [Myxococcaceae bacterium]